MGKKDGESMQEDGAEDFSTVDQVYSIQGRVRALLQSNQADFNAWMVLITEVEEKSPDDIQRICLVYESFLSEFPLCYGYWTRYAGHKARICNMNEVEEVYEQAVKAVSHSVHLWASYCSFAISSFEDPADVRRLFERGLSYVDKDYLCHLLWDKYIEFEYAQKQWCRLAHIYINILRFPTRRLQNYYESFKKLFALLEEEMGFQNAAITPPEVVPDYEMTYSKTCGYAEFSNVMDLLGQSLASPETIKKCLSLGELLYRRSSQLDKHISCFEARIRRQFFHIKPLDEFQLENWHEYLTFIEEQGNFDWTVKLYERCLIPCASYSEFWIRYVDFVDAKGGREIANHALERASNVFLKRMPSFHLYYSMFKEKIGDMVNARAPFLQCGEDFAVDTIENVNRKANMEKRTGNIEAAQEIYDKAIKMAHEKQNLEMLSLLYTNFARFTFVVTGSVSATKEVFIKGIQQNPCKSIIEGFLDFMTLHGRMNLVDAVDSTMATVLCPEVDASQALRSDDREEISQLYLKFVDLYGTIHELRKAWERHIKLFPHIMRPSALCDSSSTGFQIPRKKIEGPKGMPTNSPNHSCENPSRNVSIKLLVGNHSLKDKPNIPEDTLKSMLKSDGGTDKEKEIQGLVAAKAIVKQSTPEGDEIDVVNELVNEIQDVAQIPDASSGYHETEMIHIVPEKESQGNLETPALDNLSINSPDFVNQQANTITSRDNNAPQEVTSNDGNKPKEDDKDDDVSLVHSSGMKHLKSDTNSRAKSQENSSFSHPASHVTSPGTKTNLRPQAQQQVNANQALPVNIEYPQTVAGGSWSQVYYGSQVLPDPNSMLHSQQWQAYAQMQNQSAGANSPMPVFQSYVSQTPSLSNTQDLQVSHTQHQYQLAAAQAYMNPGIALLGQHIQQPAVVYTQAQQIQQASSQTQVQAYQHVPQIDEQYGYYQSVQGFPPHIWQYYQNLCYLQQQQLQHRQQDQQVNIDSQKQQMSDLPQQRSSQQEMLENQGEQDQMQVRPDTPGCLRDLDNGQNATKLQQNQQEKQQEPTQSKLQSLQSANSEQSQLLYLQQQQQFYLQQQQQQQMYLQQQQLLQQQQHQQFFLFQQQQLQFQHQQQQMLILPQQQEQQSQYRQQHHSPLQQHDYQEQQQTNASGLKPVESSVYSQGEGDPVQRVGQSLDSSSAK